MCSLAPTSVMTACASLYGTSVAGSIYICGERRNPRTKQSPAVVQIERRADLLFAPVDEDDDLLAQRHSLDQIAATPRKTDCTRLHKHADRVVNAGRENTCKHVRPIFEPRESLLRRLLLFGQSAPSRSECVTPC